MADEPSYSNPPTLDWAEKATAEDYVPDSALGAGLDPGESDNGYIGVDPIYQNSSTEEPLQAEEGPEAILEQKALAEDVDTTAGLPPEGEAEAAEQAAEEESGGTPTPSTSESNAPQPPPSQSTPDPSGQPSTPPSS